ncbi:hypothetical protein B0H14DRAFT_3581085 [Mycena olivaceomarginata]|nr:hypothetical protein B0H14DRAFT_3581085 [Mycena olivaceomarginata]
MAIVGSTQMALDVALTAEAAHFHQQIVHTQVLNEHGLMMLPLLATFPVLEIAQNVTFIINNFITDSFFVELAFYRVSAPFEMILQLYRCYVIWGFQKKPLILPVLLMLATLGPVFEIYEYRTSWELRQIWFSRLQQVRRSLVFQLGGYYGFGVKRRMLLLATLFAAGTIGLLGLESGAIYCIAAIFIVIGSSMNDEILSIGFGAGQQLLVEHNPGLYTGLYRPGESGDNPQIESTRNVSFDQHKPVPLVQPHRPLSFPAVLYVTKEETEDKEFFPCVKMWYFILLEPAVHRPTLVDMSYVHRGAIEHLLNRGNVTRVGKDEITEEPTIRPRIEIFCHSSKASE